MMYAKIIIGLLAVLLTAGCAEVHPHQDKIDKKLTQILFDNNIKHKVLS